MALADAQITSRLTESRKDGCFHVLGSTDPVGDLNKAAAIVVAEGYATAATLKSLHAEAGDPLGRVAFVAAFDARQCAARRPSASRAAPQCCDGHCGGQR